MSNELFVEEGYNGAKYYDKDAVDALLAKKDEEIERLKKKLMPCLNGDCILTCEVVEKYGKENAELKQKLDKAIAERDGNQVCIDALLAEKDKDIAYWREEYDKETQFTDALKDEIESLKASAYAESVDAGMRERRLRRALYKACAMWADRTRLICSVFGSNAPKIRWERMLDKCRAKAEEYR